jgi:transcriptional regulator with XRE-family HTH domain
MSETPSKETEETVFEDKLLSVRFLRRLIGETGYRNYEELASKIGASPKSLYKWLNGTSQPAAGHLYRLMCLAGRIKHE